MFKPEKSKTLLFVLILFCFVFGWFVVVAPYTEFSSLLKDASGYINKNFVDRYPDDLTIDVKAGQVSLNRPTPYCFIYNDKDSSGVIFDTNTNAAPNPADLEASGKYSKLCNPKIIIGKEYILYPDKNSTSRISKIGTDVNLVVDKPAINKFISQYLPSFFTFGKITYFTAPFILGILIFPYFLLVNTWYAMVAKFFTKVFKIKTSVTSDKIYNLTLFYYTIITAVDWVIFGYLINKVGGITTINPNFLFRNTIIITLLSLYYQSQLPALPGNDPTPKPPSK